MTVAVCGLILLARAAPAFAQPSEDQRVEARRLFEEAMDAFAAEDYPAALTLFQRSHALNPRPTTLLNIGMTHRALFDFPAAIDSFREYLRTEGSSVPSDRRAQLEEFLAEMEAAIVLLTVTVSENDAVVLVDGAEAGRSPLPGPLRIRAGPHIVEARKEGFEDAREEIRTAAGDRARLTLTLAPRAAAATTLRVVSETPGASATIDGAPAGALPIEVEVAPGPHDVRVEAPACAPWALTTQVIEGQRNDVVAVLTPLAETPAGPVEGPAAPPEEGSVVTSWWFWTIIGAVVAGGATATAVLLWPEDEGPAVDRTWWLR